MRVVLIYFANIDIFVKSVVIVRKVTGVIVLKGFLMRIKSS